MNFLHTDFWGGSEAVAVVSLNHAARVMLLDSANFSAYQRGGRFEYRGGWATASPVRLSPPCNGHWHVVIDLAGRAGSVRAGIRVVKLAA